MIKNKLFCKLMSIVCSIFITSLFGVNNNFVGAVDSRAVLDSVLEKHPDLKQSLGFKAIKNFVMQSNRCTRWIFVQNL